ncbi:NUDIX domain-containing protein [Trueperella bialowiezensis]|uniref:Predicted NTP pyrophosphohydrolase n=1 Tax=Trueperella bialowiezensis TaxID=312285 RepID=A0A3S4Z4T0_9ACTO|nr:NUDIX hydrolase [Trueperella bialowiezensis]VEI12944.1 Predicted NTP pyrophosphohydrolase [Trueperella bialowiezensis]
MRDKRAERLYRGEAFVDCGCGARHWGLFGAAGIAAWRPAATEPEMLLQLRVAWSHHGGTWAVPGGAINRGETPWQGALREFSEEAGFHDLADPSGHSVLQHPDWSYTTFVAQVADPHVRVVANKESDQLIWVPLSRLTDYELLPAFRNALPDLLQLIP